MNPTPMPTLHLLGTGAPVSDPDRTTTMLGFATEGSVILVDCGGDAIQRLLAAGLATNDVEAVILTHEHPDHIGAFPLLMEKLWLSGRRRPLPVYGPRTATDVARRLFETFDLRSWVGLPEIVWHRVPLAEGALVLDAPRWRVIASPGEHNVPVIGLRVESKETRRAIAYSCDTAPSERIARLAAGADLLVHEATGPHPGHSTILQAAEIARKSDARRLVLVHLPPGVEDASLEEARAVFPELETGEELGVYEF